MGAVKLANACPGASAASNLLLGVQEAPSTQPAITIEQYTDETQIEAIMRAITSELSEPYSIYTYRYFIHNWPALCLLVAVTPSIVAHAFRRTTARSPPARTPSWA